MVAYHQAMFPDVEYPVGNWLSIGHPAVAEICADGFDFVVIDTEHTDMGLESVTEMLRAVDAVGDVRSFVRVPWNDPVVIKRVLDLGPDGVIVPMVETAEEARDAVEAMRYPPDGRRGVAPGRASDYGRTFETYVQHADDDLHTIVQIETVRGVDNAEAIVAVDGVDAVLIGHGDLSGSLGVLGEWNHTKFRSALEVIIDATHEAGKPVWMLAIDAEGIHRWVNAGADVVIAGIDATYLVDGSDTARAEFGDAVSDADAN